MRKALDDQVESFEEKPSKDQFMCKLKITAMIQRGLEDLVKKINSLKDHEETKDMMRRGVVTPFADTLRAALLIIFDWYGELGPAWNEEYDRYMEYANNIKKALAKLRDLESPSE